MNIYKMLTCAVLFTVAVFSTPAITEASCTIFEHRDYGGAKFTLNECVPGANSAS